MPTERRQAQPGGPAIDPIVNLPAIHPVILCGGSGTRLWPSSRSAYPKQFSPLLGPESLYQATLRRFSGAGFPGADSPGTDSPGTASPATGFGGTGSGATGSGGTGFAAPMVMTACAFRFHATRQAQALGLTDARVVVEPVARDTAPAILSAALLLEDRPDALMLVSPSDHVVTDTPALLRAVAAGAAAARAGALVTFGVVPDRPETGYGYLELAAAGDHTGPRSGPRSGASPVPLASFREKPDAVTAAAFAASGRHLWNAGLFLFGVRAVIAAFETHAPDLVAPCREAIAAGSDDLGFFRLDPAAYARARSISVDYAIMEKARNVVAVPMACGWSDLGSWDALWQAMGPDADGMAVQGDATAIDCRDSYLRSEEAGMHLVGLGLDGIVAVAMRDAVLVAARDRAQEVRRVVEVLRAAGVPQACDYPRFHRPWGWYETLTAGPRFQVKRIMVHPGASLSLQSHLHRSEHWVVVEGTAEVTVGSDTRLVSENESVYIPLGSRHRLANPGRLPMYLIEVQTGAYLGEDDIIRHEDFYGRG